MERLKSKPADMPDRGKGGMPDHHSGSTTVSLNRAAHPVANLENKAGPGDKHTTSAKVALSRKVTSPYEPCSRTMPEIPFGPGKRKG